MDVHCCQKPKVLVLLILYVYILTTYLTQADLQANVRLDPRIKLEGNHMICETWTPTERYPNLFFPIEDIPLLVKQSFLTNDVRIQANATDVAIADITDDRIQIDTIKISLPAPYFKVTVSDPCCKTTMFITAPTIVRCMITDKTYKVKKVDNSYQLVHNGRCERLGAECAGNKGVCQVEYRIHWMLVEYEGGEDKFIATKVPNHCFCRY